jgi:hypothetical protein
MIAFCETGRTGKQALAAYLKVMPRYLLGKTEVNYGSSKIRTVNILDVIRIGQLSRTFETSFFTF